MDKRVFGNRYQVTEKVGMGGMAEVFKATDSTLGRSVAIKVMLPQYAADETFTARFRQEAQAAANLNSPYIVNIYDWGHDGDYYYIVMEYVRGTDLKTAVQQRGGIHPRKVAEIGSQVCSALSVAHGYGIIHRDIKSANIMVQTDGNVKVMDFGIAQAGNTGMTQDSSVLGTAHYVSPEQAQGKTLTGASDLYSLGVVMYEAATGQLPFDGPDVVSVAMKQVNDAPIPPREINPSIDSRLETIILRALAKDPADRYATADEMKRAIDDYLLGRNAATAEPTKVIETIGPEVAETSVMPPAEKKAGAQGGKAQQQKPKSKRKLLAAIVVIVVLLAAGLGIAAGSGAFASKVEVPDLTNMTREEAIAKIVDCKLKTGTIEYVPSDTVEKGHVISHSPKKGEMVPVKTAISLTLSQGSGSEALVTVPPLTGLSAAEAERALAAVGLKGVSKEEFSAEYTAGLVFKQDPEANSAVPAGTLVTYTVSMGEKVENAKIPNVVGQTEETAVETLEGLGLTVKVVDGEGDTVGVGEVLDQNISAGTEVAPGSTITITVRRESKASTVPNVIGMDKDTAMKTLRDAGYKVTTSSGEGNEGEVVDQTPGADSDADKGSTVTIVVGTGTAGDAVGNE